MSWLNRDIINVNDFSKEELEYLFNVADRFIDLKYKEILKGKIIANLFLEPSTRTRISFEVAAKRLGAEVINVTGEYSSIKKGESLYDTLKMLDTYCDMIVIRSPIEGSAQFAADVCENPVINAGDGTLNHPTQAMIDLYTIRNVFSRLDNLNIGVYGDLKYGRAVISFLMAITKYDNKIYAISPPQLTLREEVKDELISKGAKIEEITNLDQVISELDVLYVTRIQKERFVDLAEYEKVKGSYKVDLKSLEMSKPNLIVMHPLPRVEELTYELDKTSKQAYFRQAKYGIPLRMALLSLILGAEV
ncbi:MAG: aspartate carbamoyltransferase [Thermoproteota archaeon]|jgi:aspartate carbamoyltransferase (EC 2.1.3.2)